MKNRSLAVGMAIMFLIAGCILSDELTTLVIRPDGSADWFRVASNIHSSEKGAKGAQEVLKLIEDFEARRGGDFDRIEQAGGEVLDARWIQREAPYATLVTARFPTSAAVERFWTIKNEAGAVVAQARFTLDQNRRRLSLTIPVPRDREKQPTSPRSYRDLREQQANGISESRIVVANGRITASQGFTVANDQCSCILEPSEIDELLRNATGDVELFLEWEIIDEKN